MHLIIPPLRDQLQEFCPCDCHWWEVVTNFSLISNRTLSNLFRVDTSHARVPTTIRIFCITSLNSPISLLEDPSFALVLFLIVAKEQTLNFDTNVTSIAGILEDSRIEKSCEEQLENNYKRRDLEKRTVIFIIDSGSVRMRCVFIQL